MGRVLLAAVLLALLTACGSGSSDVASDGSGATPSPSATSQEGDGVVEFQEIALLSQTAAGGQVSTAAVRLDDQAEVDTFVSQFQHPGFGDQISEAVAGATVPEGYVVIGAVVAVGCDVPPGVIVTGEPDSWTIIAQKVPSPLEECFAAVTTVSVVAVPGS